MPTDPNVGLGMSRDYSRYKMFMADTGLFTTLAFWDKDYAENTVYTKLLSDKLSANLGYVYENLVAQMLTAAGHSLYYYTFPDGNNHSKFSSRIGDRILLYTYTTRQLRPNRVIHEGKSCEF